MKIEKLSISKIKANPNNPRIIKDDKFQKLVKSIQEFPQMLEIRPIVVNDEMIVLGGNMRLKACQEAGIKEIPIIKASNLTEEQQKEFIIKDNVGFGEWDWNELANVWDSEKLNQWGLDVPVFEGNLDEFFNQPDQEKKQDSGKITLEYTLEECERVKTELLKHGKTPEDAVFNLLGL
jgi:ParB-like chromosome segregation protein Spo0J